MFHCSVCNANLTVDTGLCGSCQAAAAAAADDRTVTTFDGAGAAAIKSWRFVPGTILANRYRIVSLVGEGGMGSVFRADDLKLGQTVALKFISPARASDAGWVQALHSEVRNARSVSHPNVCRVHDIGEHEGQTFLSMEYVDGEDLASLLVRIGHPPLKKVIALSWQISTGLAAAHAKGIIHRDLKPGNIMIDGRGQARITDFGLAAATGDQARLQLIAGTPGYMAPEQLKGLPAGVKTDIYSLGLVLYELHTGERPKSPSTAGRPAKPMPAPAKLNPEISREASDVILQCLRPDPQDRPASALEVSAAFSFDPIAEAMIGDQTPGPDLVASIAAPELSPRAAWLLFAAVLLGLGALLVMARYMEVLALVPVKSPEVLAERAREVARDLGYVAPTGDSYYRLDGNYPLLRFRVVQSPPVPVPTLPSAPQGVAVLNYRQSESHPLASLLPLGLVSFPDLADDAGDLTVTVDSRGLLLRFVSVPAVTASGSRSSAPADWTTALRASGVDLESLRPSSDRSFVPYAYQERQEWDGAYPGSPAVPVHVVATATDGRVGYFDVRAPWNSAATQKIVLDKADVISRASISIATLLVLFLGIVVVRNNIRTRRADLRGALKVAAFVLVITLCSDMLLAHFPSDTFGAIRLARKLLASPLFNAAFVWVAYVAVEPFIRKRMPQVLNSWIRFLEGRTGDPGVGRAILIGALLGVVMELGTSACWYLPAWFGVQGVPLSSPFWEFMIGTRELFGAILAAAGDAVFDALGTLIFFYLARTVLRHNGAALVATFLFLAAAGTGGDQIVLAIASGLIVGGVCLLALLRFGLLAYVTCLFVYFVLIKFPHILNLDLWFSAQALTALFVVVVTAGFGLLRSVGNQSLFADPINEV